MLFLKVDDLVLDVISFLYICIHLVICSYKYIQLKGLKIEFFISLEFLFIYLSYRILNIEKKKEKKSHLNKLSTTIKNS